MRIRRMLRKMLSRPAAAHLVTLHRLRLHFVKRCTNLARGDFVVQPPPGRFHLILLIWCHSTHLHQVEPCVEAAGAAAGAPPAPGLAVAGSAGLAGSGGFAGGASPHVRI